MVQLLVVPVFSTGSGFADVPITSPVKGVTLTNDNIVVDSPNGTIVGVFEHANLQSVSLDDDQGGKFKLLTNPYRLAAGSNIPDFLDYVTGSLGNPPGSPPAAGKECGLPHYTVVVTLTMDDLSTEQWTFRVRPRYRKVTDMTSGGDAASVTELTDFTRSGLLAALNGANNRRIRYGASAPSYITGSTTTDDLTADNVTLESRPDGNPPKPVILRGATLDNRGSDRIYRGIIFGAGDDVEGVTLSNRDAHSNRSGRRIIYDHCTFLWSIDELMSFSPGSGTGAGALDPPRHALMIDCAFVDPLNNTAHPDAPHAYALLIAERVMHVDLVRCLYLDPIRRTPVLGSRVTGIYQVNNVIGQRGSLGAVGFSSLQTAEPSNNDNISYIGLNNLFMSTNAPTSERWIRIGSGSYLYTAGSRVGSPADPWGVAWDDALHRQLANGSTSASRVTSKPFEPPDYPVMPLASSPDADALFDFVMDNAGARARNSASGDWITGDLALPEALRQRYADFRANTRVNTDTVPAGAWDQF